MKSIYLVFAYFDCEAIGGFNDLQYKTSDYKDAFNKAKTYQDDFDCVHIYEAIEKGIVYEWQKGETVQDLQNKIKKLKEND